MGYAPQTTIFDERTKGRAYLFVVLCETLHYMPHVTRVRAGHVVDEWFVQCGGKWSKKGGGVAHAGLGRGRGMTDGGGHSRNHQRK